MIIIDIHLYGFFNKVDHSRKIKETNENKGKMWITLPYQQSFESDEGLDYFRFY